MPGGKFVNVLMCIGDVAGHSGEAKEGVCREGDIFNEEAIGPVVPCLKLY